MLKVAHNTLMLVRIGVLSSAWTKTNIHQCPGWARSSKRILTALSVGIWYTYSMKRIAICGSMTAWREMFAAAGVLRARGYDVLLPDGTEEFAKGTRVEETASESVANKLHGDLIREYYKKIKISDAVLVINVPKHGRDGYIGGNAFLEFAFGHVLDKPVYLLHDFDHESSYADEMEAMQPIILEDDLSRIAL